MAEFDEFSWAVGLFEGEGCIGSLFRRGYHEPHLSLTMTDKDIVDRFAQIFPGGSHYTPPLRPNRKQAYTYRIFARDKVEATLIAMQPYLSHKKSIECACELEHIKAAKVRPRKQSARQRSDFISHDEQVQMAEERRAGWSFVTIGKAHKISATHASKLVRELL